MRAALYHGRQDLRLTSVPEPEAGPGEVKLRVRYNGICGSDLLEYFDGPVTTRDTPHQLTDVKNTVIMGHELCGEVVALGAGIEDLAVGTLVAVEPVETCGRCLYCGLGQYNHCPTLAIQGYNRPGGLAEYTVVKRRMAHPLPPGVSALEGALDRKSTRLNSSHVSISYAVFCLKKKKKKKKTQNITQRKLKSYS